jgi:hypothetical protein
MRLLQELMSILDKNVGIDRIRLNRNVDTECLYTRAGIRCIYDRSNGVPYIVATSSYKTTWIRHIPETLGTLFLE